MQFYKEERPFFLLLMLEEKVGHTLLLNYRVRIRGNWFHLA